MKDMCEGSAIAWLSDNFDRYSPLRPVSPTSVGQDLHDPHLLVHCLPELRVLLRFNRISNHEPFPVTVS